MQQFVGRSLFLCAVLTAAPAWAEDAADEGATVAQDSIQGHFLSALAAATHGPARVVLSEQATIQLPRGEQFVPRLEAQKLLTAMGNTNDETVLGVVLPEKNVSDWMVVASFEPDGYIKDDDAKDWDADGLLKSLREGVTSSNEARQGMGLPQLEVVGWVEKPTYDAKARRLVWCASFQERGATADAERSVNYNTFALGREGYISLNLVTELKRVETDKAVAKQLLSALQFSEGKRYQDFNASTDKVAEYGLAALVAGVAAKKLGLFALIAAFFVKSFKLLVLGAIGVIVAMRERIFGKKAEPAEAAELTVPAESPESTAPASPAERSE